MSISRLIRTGLAGLAVLASTPLMADQLPIPVDAKVVGQTSAQELEQEQERVYPLGSLRKISNVVRMEGKVEGRGKVSYATYQLPAERSANEAFTAAREALQTAGGYPLFWCQGQDCGESSLWSAQLAGRFNLTGADNQHIHLIRDFGGTVNAIAFGRLDAWISGDVAPVVNLHYLDPLRCRTNIFVSIFATRL